MHTAKFHVMSRWGIDLFRREQVKALCYFASRFALLEESLQTVNERCRVSSGTQTTGQVSVESSQDSSRCYMNDIIRKYCTTGKNSLVIRSILSRRCDFYSTVVLLVSHFLPLQYFRHSMTSAYHSTYSNTGSHIQESRATKNEWHNNNRTGIHIPTRQN
jgi:hypothetical protein